MELPSRLGRYELVRLLGEGGMGRVYEAVLHGPAGFRKRIALKVLKPGGGGLIREARLGGMLRHPNLVEVYALEQVGDQWVCAMELVRGGTLRAFLPLSPRAVVDVALQVCEGLRSAHRDIGMVHLDLKPDNLMLQGTVVKVGDLGVARADGFASHGKVAGTKAYMAPEQRAGAPVDARADVWGLGVVMIELATGKPGRDPSLVPSLAPVLARCLATDPNDRYRSMSEVGRALRELEPPGADLAASLGGAALHSTGSVGTGSGDRRGTDTFLLERAAPTTNLGAEPDAFVGREADEAWLAAALDHAGVVTLKGAGGLGKTRLARRVARAWGQRAGGQAWFVDLTAATTRLGLLGAVAATFDVALSGPTDALVDQLGHAIAARGPMVVVLDNFEQLVAHAGVVACWAEHAPDSRWLVTSREPLQVRGERVWELGPLDDGAGARLLRVRAAQLGVTLGPDDVDLLALARRLDNLPLALELAASRLTVLSPAGVLARLDDRLRILTSTRRDLSPRQATVRGTLDWSWELLSEAERVAFCQCAVFVGGFTVEAAEGVLELPGELWQLDVIESLLRKSLLTLRDGRLFLFETTRAYAGERLVGDGALRRHARWYAALGAEDEARARALRGGGARIAALHLERDNLLAAVDRAASLGEPTVAADAVLAVSEIFEAGGPMEPWHPLVERVLALDGLDVHRRGRLERAASRAAEIVGLGAEALAHAERALALHREEGDRGAEGIALNNLAMVNSGLDRIEPAREQLHQAIALLREVGDRRFEGVALGNLGSLESDQGRSEAALRHQVVAHRLLEDAGDVRGAARALSNLGNVYGGLGDGERAITCYESAISGYRRVGAVRLEAIALGNLTTVLVRLGRLDAAEARCAEAIRLLRGMGDRRNLGVALATSCNVLTEAGRVAEARSAGAEALAVLEAVGDATWAAITAGFLGRLALVGGEPAAAVTHLEVAVRGVEGRHALAHASLLGSLGEARARAGDRDRGLEDLRAAIDRLEALGYREELVEAQQALARVLAG